MSRDPRDPYEESDRRNGRSSAGGNGPSSPSRSSRPSDPGTGRRTPPNGLIKPPLPNSAGGPRSRPSSNPPSDPRSGRRAGTDAHEKYTLARMHSPRGPRPEPVERPERDVRPEVRAEREERAPRGNRSVGQMARDLSRSMSRSIQALGRSFSRAIREAGTYEPRGVRPALLPPDLMEELAEQPYRRSRARLVARKWRLQRVRPNPVVYAKLIMLLLVAVVGVLGVGGAGGIYAVTYYQSHQDQIQQIYNLRFTQGVQILDRNGKTLYVARSDQNGINIYTPLTQISDKVWKATVDTEDATFWTNQGVDLYRTIGAL